MKKLLLIGAMIVGCVLISSAQSIINGHEYVDLGLSVKWATCNVGATTPEGYGDYFAWGEIKPKSEYSASNSGTEGKKFGDISGDSRYDAARANWGGTWRLPTKQEIEELVNLCTWNWTSSNGHEGCCVTGPNGNSIYLPAAGFCGDTLPVSAGIYGYYWSSTPNESHTESAYEYFFSSSQIYQDVHFRHYGLSVRAVTE